MPKMSVHDVHGPINFNKEVWRPMAGFENRYEVSWFGRVRSLAMNRPRHGRDRFYKALIKRPRLCRKGYHYVGLTDDSGRESSRPVHQLVLEAFGFPKTPERPEVRHLNGERCNNQLRNLTWGTRKEQSDDQERHGTRARGTQMPHAVLTEEIVAEIRREYAKGVLRSELARRFPGGHRNIYRICAGERWKHVK